MDQTKLIEAETIETPEIHWDHLRKLMQGTTKDPRISTLYPIIRALNASFDRTLGLAPERDFEREEETYDATLMDAMRNQLETMMREREAVSTAGINANAELLRTLSAKVDEQDKRLDAKRSRLSEQEQEIAVLNERIGHKDKTISNLEGLFRKRGETIDCLRRELKYQRIFVTVLVLILVLLCGYFVWELLPWNIDKGLTGMWLR